MRSMIDTIARRCANGLAVALVSMAGACTTPGPVPETVQPSLSSVASTYADGLRDAGVRRVLADGARVQLTTRYGEVYFRYPPSVMPTAFAAYIGGQSVEVDSDTFSAANAAQYEAALRAVLPEAIRQANANNALESVRGMGGGGGM